MSKKLPPLFLGRKSGICWFFSILSRKTVSGSRLHGVCMGRSGTSAYAVYALSSQGGSSQGMQFFTLDSSKIEVFQTYFFDTMIT